MSDQRPFHAPKDHYKIIATVQGPEGQQIDLIDRAEYDKLAARLAEAEKVLKYVADTADSDILGKWVSAFHLIECAREHFKKHGGNK